MGELGIRTYLGDKNVWIRVVGRGECSDTQVRGHLVLVTIDLQLISLQSLVTLTQVRQELILANYGDMVVFECLCLGKVCKESCKQRREINIFELGLT